jgi:hypothetical protein
MKTREQMREYIRSIQGEYITETVFTYTDWDGRVVRVVAYGYENYPDADMYEVQDSVKPLHGYDVRADIVEKALLKAFIATKDGIYTAAMEAFEERGIATW